MWASAITTLILSYLAFGNAFQFAEFLRFTPVPAPADQAIPGSTPSSHGPAPTLVVLDDSIVEVLE